MPGGGTPGDKKPGGGTFGGITLTVPDATTKKKPDLYGLGAWRDQIINPGSLPTTINTIAAGKQTTAEQIVESFTHGRPDQVATVQHALLMAGDYYPNGYTPKWGVVSARDVQAFAKAVQTAGQAGKSVSDLITAQASVGAQLGLQAAQARQSVTKTVTLPNTQDLEAVATGAFEKILGKKATPEQAAGFAAIYRSIAVGVQRAQAQAEFDAQNPPLGGPLATTDPTKLVTDMQTPAPIQVPADPDQMRGRPTTALQTVPGDPLSFSDKIGGLMTLGQAIAASQPQATPGLSFVTEDSLPSAQTAAENYARNSNPKGAAATETANTFNTFLSLLSRNFG